MRVSVDSQQPQGDVLMRAYRVLGGGGVVAYPTETFYGLAVSVFDAAACATVFEIKGRPASKALTCILSDIEQLELVASTVSPLARELASEFWPGPLSIILPAQADVAAASEEGTIAVRVSSLPLARALADVAGPITATSANISGAPPAMSADEVLAQLGEAVALILDGGRSPVGEASTIVDITSGRPRLVRAGAVVVPDVIEP